MISKFVITITFLLFNIVSQAAAPRFSEDLSYPGGVAVIQLGKFNTAPEIEFNGDRVLVREIDGEWQAIIGIGLSEKVGKKEAILVGTNKKYQFEIKPKEYESQYITLKTNKHVNLSKTDLDRHYKEKNSSRLVLDYWWEQKQPDLNFIQPVEGRYSSPFGLKRFYNNQPRKPHSGLDIAAPKGTTIVAPTDGKVVLTGDFFFNGNVIFIDHGQGVVTMYCHMSKIVVDEGQIVKKGEKIAEVGTTGRSTGAHLHWGVSLNGNMVDPLIFLNTEKQQEQKKEENKGKER